MVRRGCHIIAYKKAILVVDDVRYLYTVTGKGEYIKVIVYLDSKVPYFTAYFSCAEAWGLDVYAPKTISILIGFYNENSSAFEQNKFIVKECPELFRRLVDYHFTNGSHAVREQFFKACKDTNIEDLIGLKD